MRNEVNTTEENYKRGRERVREREGVRGGQRERDREGGSTYLSSNHCMVLVDKTNT